MIGGIEMRGETTEGMTDEIEMTEEMIGKIEMREEIVIEIEMTGGMTEEMIDGTTKYQTRKTEEHHKEKMTKEEKTL